MAITFQVTGFGTPNLSFSISVIGSAISVQLETGNTGMAITTVQAMYAALVADASVTALVTPSDVAAGSELFNSDYPATDVSPSLTVIILGEVFCFVLTASAAVPVYTSQLAFVGVRRVQGIQPLLGACRKYKPSTYTYVLTGTLAVGQVKGYDVAQAPVILRQTINDFDFELHQVVITYTPAADVTLPSVCSALMLYDAVKEQTANIPPLDKFWNGAPDSPYENGGIVPPLVYPQQTQIRVDLFNLLQDADLPVTVNVHLVGKNRKPC